MQLIVQLRCLVRSLQVVVVHLSLDFATGSDIIGTVVHSDVNKDVGPVVKVGNSHSY